MSKSMSKKAKRCFDTSGHSDINKTNLNSKVSFLLLV